MSTARGWNPEPPGGVALDKPPKRKGITGGDPNLRDRAAKWREADRRKGEARVLAWWRAVYGTWLPEKDLVAPDGKVTDPTTLPVNRFGPVGYARALALETEEGRAAFERSYRTGRALPSCAQFAMANQILRRAHGSGVP